MKKKYCVIYYCADNEKVLTKTCDTLEELELFRRYLSRQSGIDELDALEITLIKVVSAVCVYDTKKI